MGFDSKKSENLHRRLQIRWEGRSADFVKNRYAWDGVI